MAFGRENPDNSEILKRMQESESPDQELQENDQQEDCEDSVHIPESREASEDNKPNTIDGWVHINRDELPHGGKLYPETWEFIFRCPTAKEIVTFSTLDNSDTPNVYIAVEDLIKKCVRIWDNENEKEIASSEINDSDRTFFMLKLRDFYIADENQSVKLDHVCQSCFEDFQAELHSSDLIYKDLSDALLEDFDGRVFHLDMGTVIDFRIPTISTTGRFFRYMVQVIRDNQRNADNRAQAKIFYNKTFLKIAPFLFITGRESVKDIISKYKMIEKNDELISCYMEIIDNITMSNEEYIKYECPHCGVEDTVQISFPAWSKFFKKFRDQKGYFAKND